MASNASNTSSYTIRGNEVTVTASGTESLYGIPAPATVHIVPGEGGTMSCQVRPRRNGTLIDLDAGNASFSAATTYTLYSPVYEIVFGATTANGYGACSWL